MDTPLHLKLRTALITTHRTMVLGSGNKITHFQKGNGWNFEVFSNMRKNSDRLYQCYPLVKEEDPLQNLPALIRNLVKEYIVVLKKERVGNCGELARFISLYLWQHAGKEIDNIEVVSATEFDHTWVILNRKEGTDLLKPEEWGEDTWIIDPWWGDEGIFYLADEFHEKMVQLLAYCKEQDHWFYEHNQIKLSTLTNSISLYERYAANLNTQQLSVPLTFRYAINPQILPYPIDKNSKRSLENYYDFSPYPADNYDCRIRALNEKNMHQQKFLPCLQAINKTKIALK